MFADFKITTWERVDLRNTKLTKEQILECLKAQQVSTNDLCELDDRLSSDYLYETDTPMTPEDNDGWATVELYEDDGELIYANGKH